MDSVDVRSIARRLHVNRLAPLQHTRLICKLVARPEHNRCSRASHRIAQFIECVLCWLWLSYASYYSLHTQLRRPADRRSNALSVGVYVRACEYRNGRGSERDLYTSHARASARAIACDCVPLANGAGGFM